MERATRRYRAAVVGLGPMGSRHARVLGSLSARFDLVGGFDVCADVAKTMSLAPLRSEAEAIALSDVVVVATPIESHGSIVSSALAAGRHVLVEKPLCATAAEARALVAAQRSGGRLFVGHSERFNPVIRALARIVCQKDVLAIDLRRVGASRPSRHGVLLNLGVHDLDLAAYLGGEVALRAAAGTRRAETETEDVAHALLTAASGAVVRIYLERTVLLKQRRIALTTHRWRYEGDLVAHRLARVDLVDASRADVPLAPEEPLVAQATALADALDAGIPGEIATGADGEAAVALAEQAAARCKTVAPPPVRLPLPAVSGSL